MNKFEKRFVRMMMEMFGLISALIIIMSLIKLPVKIIIITSMVLLFISYMVKRIYWTHLEGLELKEKCDKAVIEGVVTK